MKQKYEAKDLQALVDVGREQGYLTFKQVNSFLPQDIISPAALRAAREFEPEVVLLDIGLPRMDGYEVARRLRAQERGKRTRLVAVTGYGQEEDRRQSQEAGFDQHLVKPVAPETLQRLIAQTGA